MEAQLSLRGQPLGPVTIRDITPHALFAERPLDSEPTNAPRKSYAAPTLGDLTVGVSIQLHIESGTISGSIVYLGEHGFGVQISEAPDGFGRRAA